MSLKRLLRILKSKGDVMNPIIKIAGRKIGYKHDPIVIADIGINHGGSLDVAKHMVDFSNELFDAMGDGIKRVEEKNKRVLDALKKNSFINIGIAKDYTIKQFAKMIGKLFNEKINLKFNKSYPDGTPRKLLDNSIIYSMGWRPIVSTEEGLRKTVEWYKKNIK